MSCPMWTLNGSSNPKGPKTEETLDKSVLWVICVSKFFASTLYSSTVHWIWSAGEPTLLGSTSTCFVLPIDLSSCGISSVTVLRFLIHFSIQIHVLMKGNSVPWKHWFNLQECWTTWLNCPLRSCFWLPLVKLETSTRCRLPPLQQLLLKSRLLYPIMLEHFPPC